MTPLRITLAGNVIVEIDGRRLPDAGLGPRGQVVLAFLVLERHRQVPAGELADATWAIDLPSTWRPALRGIVTRVRRFLELPRADSAISLDSRLGCYRLTLPEDAEVDVERAVAAYDSARTALDKGDHAEALRQGQASVALSRDEFLPGAGGTWVEGQQLRLRNLHLNGLELVSEAAAGLGEWDTAREAAEAILAREAYREPAYVLLMKALAGAGNVTEATMAYRRCCDVLEQELGATPSTATQDAFLAMSGAGRAEPAPAGAGSRSRPLTNLPAGVSTFVGRTGDMVTLRARLTSSRLVTLTGTAGVGKSRLAVETARPLAPNVGDGVWLVELAETIAGVARQVASVLRLRDTPGCDAVASLCEHLAAKELLLVLDNCEHVLPEAAEVTRRLLGACPRVRILATSREPLHVPGELIWPVGPLSLPVEPGDRPPADLYASEAVQLFADRASSARPGLDVDLQAIAGLCRRLDGLPLAIELAAAHARVFTVRELAGLLADQPELVTRSTAPTDGGRHHSLAAALDWSYQFLGDAERAVLQRLSVFAGGFTADAATTICADLPVEPLAALTTLVDKSFVTSWQGTTTRFRLLETVRAYAWSKLAAGQDDARGRHLEWACDLTGAGAGELRQRWQPESLGRLDAEQGNLRAALRWSVDAGRKDQGLQLAVALTRYWEVRGYLSEGRSWLEELAASTSADPKSRAAALNAAGVLANHQSDFGSARVMLDEALVLRRSLDDARGVAASLNGLASVAVAAGDYDEARPIFEEILDIGRRLHDDEITATCLVNLAAVTEHAVEEGLQWPYSLADAREWLLEASAMLRETGDLRGVAQAYENLGVVSAMEHHPDRARGYFRQCLELYRRLGDRKGVAGTVRFLGQLSYRDGDYASAAQLLEECLSLERELGSVQRSAEALGFLGAIAEAAGRVADARRLYRESLAAYAEAGNPAGADEVLRRLLDLEPVGS